MSNSENEPHEEEYNEEEEQNLNDIDLSGNNLTDVTELLSKLENEDQILSVFILKNNYNSSISAIINSLSYLRTFHILSILTR